jgi:dephospho-CoA kinase
VASSTQKPIIGIAGGIGSGKSTVAAMLARLGCVVADSDRDARAVLADPAVRDQLVQWWGRQMLNEDGEVDRSAVAAVVFGDAVQRRRLEQLVHPRVETCRRELFESAGAEAAALVIDAPLLIEAGLDQQCDAIIFVESDPEVRRRRVQERGWDDTELKKREESQMPLDVKRSRADHLITNDADLEHLESQVRDVFRHITGSSE